MSKKKNQLIIKLEELKLKEFKNICTDQQKQNKDCENCPIYNFCDHELTTSYPSGWKIEGKEIEIDIKQHCDEK